jgi:hypothetical protein
LNLWTTTKTKSLSIETKCKCNESVLERSSSTYRKIRKSSTNTRYIVFGFNRTTHNFNRKSCINKHRSSKYCCLFAFQERRRIGKNWDTWFFHGQNFDCNEFVFVNISVKFSWARYSPDKNKFYATIFSSSMITVPTLRRWKKIKLCVIWNKIRFYFHIHTHFNKNFVFDDGKV